MQNLDPTGLAVLIIAGEFAGEEGVCLGRPAHRNDMWEVSPNSSDRVVELRFEEEFGLLIICGQPPSKN